MPFSIVHPKFDQAEICTTARPLNSAHISLQKHTSSRIFTAINSSPVFHIDISVTIESYATYTGLSEAADIVEAYRICYKANTASYCKAD
jgi:hypothetical protein